MSEAVHITCDQMRMVEREITIARAERAAHCRPEGMDDRTKVICRSRNRMLGRSLAELNEAAFGRRGILKRAARLVENAWAMLWAVGHCWAEIGEAMGLWVREDEQKTTI